MALIFQGQPISPVQRAQTTAATVSTMGPGMVPQGKPVQHGLPADARPMAQPQKKTAMGRARGSARLPSRLLRAVSLLQRVIANHKYVY